MSDSRYRHWAWPVVLVAGLLAFWAVREATLETDNPNFVPSLILIGAAVMPVTFVTFISGRRISYGVGGGLVALTALVGGVIGVVTAGVLEYDTLHDLGALPMAGVAVIEEGAKLIVPVILVIALRRKLPGDGILIGVASGAGFAVLETMGYAFVELIQSRGSIQAVDDILFLRGLLSPAAHMAWTGLTAAALFSAARHGWRGRSILEFWAVYLLAVILHASWDSLGTYPAYVVLAVVSLALLGVAVHRASVESRSPVDSDGPAFVTAPAV